MALAEDLKSRGGLDLRKAFIDGTFAPAKKGGLESVKPSGAKVRRSGSSPKELMFQLEAMMIFILIKS